jgi:transcriptional regulator with XRE-family HTH domain
MRKNLATHDQSGPSKPGQAIRALRNKLGLTLQEVSQRTGLAISTISKLEMGRASLSYEKLSLVSAGLGVNMSELLGLLGESPGSEAAPYVETFLAVELLNKQLVPLIVDVRARSIQEFTDEFGGLIRHSGEEFIYILEGEVEFHTDFYAPVRLKQGESVYFDSSMGHAFLAASEGPCRLLSVCTDPDQEQRVIDLVQKEE